jgi:hypothetical protein
VRGVQVAESSRKAGGKLGVRSIVQSPAMTRSRLVKTIRCRAGCVPSRGPACSWPNHAVKIRSAVSSRRAVGRLDRLGTVIG